jgi:DNA-binding transcriptional regulator LsrR (DeoR family)
MSDRHATGPARLVLAAAVARRYYLEGETKVEIAGQLGLSRFKVARLLEEARASGIVRTDGRRHHLSVADSAGAREI